jgi:hypothetical protein
VFRQTGRAARWQQLLTRCGEDSIIPELPAGMTELREMRGGAAPSSAARYSRLEGTDDSLRIKVRTLDNESTWEVEGEGSWTVRQFKDHVSAPPAPVLHVFLAAAPLALPVYACSHHA